MTDIPPMMILLFGLGAGFLLSDLLWCFVITSMLVSLDKIKKRLRIEE